MDNSLFDDIIKNKLEGHIDPSGPSASELGRMLDSMPNTSGMVSSITTATKIATAASVIFLITTIFLIYRTYSLNDALSIVQHELINLGKQNQEILYKYDTLYWDSLQHFTRQAIQEQYQPQPFLANNNNEQQAGFSFSAGDSERMVSQLMEELKRAVEDDPEFRKLILQQLEAPEEELPAFEAFATREEPGGALESLVFDGSPAKQASPSKTDLTAVLLDLASDEAHAKKLTNLMLGLDPDTPEEDQLNLSSSQGLKAELMVMSEEDQAAMIEDFSRNEPEATNLSIRSLGLDSVFASTLDKNEFLLSTLPSEKDSLLIAEQTREEALPIVRKEKKPVSWWLQAGGGAGVASINSSGNSSTTIFHAGVERRIGDRIGIIAGAEYQSTEGESFDVDNFDYSVFEDFEAEDVKEIKTYLTWMDIPLEARFYVLPGRKVNPFLGVSLRLRTLLSESYKVETNTGDEINPSFASNNSDLSFPAFGVGAGAQFYLNPRLFGELKVNQSFGGSELNLLGDRLNSLTAQGSLFIRLSKIPGLRRGT